METVKVFHRAKRRPSQEISPHFRIHLQAKLQAEGAARREAIHVPGRVQVDPREEWPESLLPRARLLRELQLLDDDAGGRAGVRAIHEDDRDRVHRSHGQNLQLAAQGMLRRAR